MKKLIAALAFAAFATVTFAQTPATTTTKTTTTTTTKEKKVVAATPAPTAQEIANAKDKGLVWVNTSAKVYHYKEGRYYGKTKQGKFMTEDDAKAAGYTPVKAAVVKKKSEAAK
jgi:hypothetical protein